MLASDIITVAAKQLNDLAYTRWTLADHYAYLTEGLRQCVLIQPRANAVTASVQLTAATTRQAIPDAACALIDIVRNMGVAGTTPGYAITVADRQTLDTANAGWHDADGSTVIDNYTYDDRSPTIFYVTPPVHATTKVYVEICYAKSPTAVTALADALEILDIYQGPLLEYQLYRCLNVNHASEADRQTAQTHLGYFYAMLGEKEKAAMMLSPNNPQNVVG